MKLSMGLKCSCGNEETVAPENYEILKGISFERFTIDRDGLTCLYVQCKNCGASADVAEGKQ